MAGSLTKGLIGKEDLNVQQNTAATETFTRLSSTGDTLTLEKIPDMWDGLGKINVSNVTATTGNITTVAATTITATAITATTITTPATDPGDIAETIALGTLTHDVLKAKINALLAAMRVAGFFT